MTDRSRVIDAAATVAEFGFPSDLPMSLAALGPQGIVLEFVSGSWPDGRAVARDDLFYGASLAKQVTGAAIAMLVRRGQIDPDAPVGQFLVDLPAWASRVTVRQLLGHTSGLPPASEFEASPPCWTDGYVINVLKALASASSPPGTAFAYSNAGYVCLARIVETVTGLAFGTFVEQSLLRPLQIESMRFLPEMTVAKQSHAALMGPILPLSTGDGGLWTTAAAYGRWLDHQNRDTLGIAPLVTQPGGLPDGRATDYGWGIGIRAFRNHPIFIHGGGWTGAFAKAVRCPDLGLSVVGFAADVSADRVVALVDALFAQLADIRTS